jgi:prophage tail gpP-like protein
MSTVGAHREKIGEDTDAGHLIIDGAEFPYFSRYSVKTGVLAQPSNISFTLGGGRPGKDPLPVKELMRIAEQGKQFQYKIGPTLVQSGVIEDYDVSDSDNGTIVTFSGRDWIWPLVKNSIKHEVDFGQPTYFELTRKVLDICGLSARKLFGDDNARRKSMSRSTKATAKPSRDLVETIPTNTLTSSNAKVNLQRIVGKVGGTWFDFLKGEYKKVGLYLWATPEGNFVLARPTANMPAIYVIRRKRGLSRSESNVISWGLSNKSSGRNAFCTVFGKGANHAKGVHKTERTWNDFEMVGRGFTDEKVVYDDDAKTPKDAEYIAKRTIAESIRDNWTLNYTVSGLTTPGLLDKGKMLIWTPNTCVRVYHEELGDFTGERKYEWIDPESGKEYKLTRTIEGASNSAFASGQDCYIPDVEFSQSPQATTKLRVMRKQDLYFLGESDDKMAEESRSSLVR